MTETDIISQQLMDEIMQDDDPVHQAEVIATIAIRAKELRVKGEFDKVVKAARQREKEIAKQNKQQVLAFNSVTDFGDERYDNMRCGCWIADRDGVRTITQLGEVVACYHPILPVQLLINAETGLEKIKIAFKKRNRWKEVIVDKDIIASANKIVGLAKYGISVTSENARNLVKYLNDLENYNADRITEQVSTSKLGWIKGEFMPYGHSIIVDSDQQFKDAYESIHPEGNPEVWYDLVREIRKSYRLEPKIYLAASFASVLVEPLGALPFIVSLWGDSGKGKTVALMLAASIWADPSEKSGYMTDPKSTMVGLEVRMDFLNSLPMLIDDLAQVKQKFEGDFTELVYYLCSGKGKERSNANLGLNKVKTWKNAILTNSERSMVNETMQGGAINRIIDVEMTEGYIFNDGNKVADTLRNNYGFAGYEFIKIIQDVGMETIKGMQQMYYSMILEKAKEQGVEKEEKQILPMSIILTADKLSSLYLFEDGIELDINTCIDLLKNKSDVSENDRAYDFILSDVSIHTNNFKPDINGNYRGERWGCFEHGYVVIQNNVFNDMAKRGNFSSKAFLSWAAKNELIKQDSQGKNFRNKKFDGNATRCVFLKLPDDTNTDFVEISEEEQQELPFMN